MVRAGDLLQSLVLWVKELPSKINEDQMPF